MITKKDIDDTPATTGVYLFYQGKTPIYIGKAVNIKARLISHIRNATLDNKEQAIISQADSIQLKTTLSEFDALLLEAQLIKKYRPKYNISWKDDKSYLYIKITVKEMFPKINVVRAENDGESLYFGPFKSSRIARLLIREIRRVVPFCMQKKITKSACFYAKIGLCDPCPNIINSPEEKTKYKQNIKQVMRILGGKSTSVLTSLTRELKQYTERQEYEKALLTRNRIDFLRHLVSDQSFESHEYETNDSYDKNMHTELSLLLSNVFHNKTEKTEYRIECYDISNLSGSAATASMVVFTNARSNKAQYRKFKIKTVHSISDFDMLREVMRRRLKHTEWPMPDLLVIDGGRPQLRAVTKVFSQEFPSLKVSIIGIAKHPDRIYSGNLPFDPIPFETNSSLFMVIKAIRDESHRFAKKYHVLLRKQKLLL